MRKPIIGVTPSVDEEKHRCLVQPGYLESIDKAGGLGMMLPLTDRDEDITQFVELCDGFLFVGGPDIEPWRYGQELLPECGPQNKARDAMEWKLMEAALAADKPVLGVCRGLQVLNTVLGGTLYQDIPSQLPETFIKHKVSAGNVQAHKLEVKEGTLLYGLIGPSADVNSSHHQSVKKLAPGFVISAVSEDGVVEAIEMTGAECVIGVQFHPEGYVANDNDSLLPIIEHLIRSAK